MQWYKGLSPPFKYLIQISASKIHPSQSMYLLFHKIKLSQVWEWEGKAGKSCCPGVSKLLSAEVLLSFPNSANKTSEAFSHQEHTVNRRP